MGDDWSLVCSAVPSEENQALGGPCLALPGASFATRSYRWTCALDGATGNSTARDSRGGFSGVSWGFRPPAAICLLIHPLQDLSLHSHKTLLWALRAWPRPQLTLISEKRKKTSCFLSKTEFNLKLEEQMRPPSGSAPTFWTLLT